jgi:hypothetical protein
LALITRTIPALLNGISQQPAILRSSDQTEDELNTWSRIAEGVSRRPPTQVVAKLTASPPANLSIHHINRDVNERYLVLIQQGAILVFDETTGAEKTVNAPRGWGYLDTSGDVYRAMSIADYTFIVNTTKTVALKGAGADQTADNANNRFPAVLPQGLRYARRRLYRRWRLLQYRPNPTYSGGLTGTVPGKTSSPPRSARAASIRSSARTTPPSSPITSWVTAPSGTRRSRPA